MKKMKTKVIKQDIGTVQIKRVYGGVRIQFNLCRKKDRLTQRENLSDSTVDQITSWQYTRIQVDSWPVWSWL